MTQPTGDQANGQARRPIRRNLFGIPQGMTLEQTQKETMSRLHEQQEQIEKAFFTRYVPLKEDDGNEFDRLTTTSTTTKMNP